MKEENLLKLFKILKWNINTKKLLIGNGRDKTKNKQIAKGSAHNQAGENLKLARFSYEEKQDRHYICWERREQSTGLHWC